MSRYILKELPSNLSSEVSVQETLRDRQASYRSLESKGTTAPHDSEDLETGHSERPLPHHYDTAPPLYRPSSGIDTPPPLPEKSWEQRRYLCQPGNSGLRLHDPSQSRPIFTQQPSSSPSTPLASDDEDDRPEHITTFSADGDGAQTSADVTQDGRIDMVLNLKKALPNLPSDYAISFTDDNSDPNPDAAVPSLNIVIFITGSRGDVQPYLSLALDLILCDSRHRVRICTHGVFREFVLGTGKNVLRNRLNERKRNGTWKVRTTSTGWSSVANSAAGSRSDDGTGPDGLREWQNEKRWTKEQREGLAPVYTESPAAPYQSRSQNRPQTVRDLAKEEEDELLDNLEFFDIGGSPKDLMAYMVKNPGLLPGRESLTNGDIPKKQKMVKEMLHKFLRSIYFPDEKTGRSFAADAIISNPPSFAHVHIAEMAGLPLIISFTMPWSPTTEFNHPLVNIKQSNAEHRLTNYLSYGLAEVMTWQGLGPTINRFRRKELFLSELQNGEGPGLADRLKIPHIYCWSSAVVPKPKDWKAHIDVVGYFFLQEGGEYKPEPELAKFLRDGPPPIYIGFGSIVVDDPAAMTKTIFDAVERTGVRALVSAGWSDIGGDNVPDDVFILGEFSCQACNVPHDWLFAEGRVSAVCHHGGAGTTAIGLKNGLPTIVVPFFGDQPFQGAMVARAGAGPEPIPFKKFNVDTLSKAIQVALSPEVKQAAWKFGQQIRSENGEEAAVKSFHKFLPLLNMRCDLEPSRVAVWRNKDLALRLSGLAAYTLVDAGLMSWDDVRPNRTREYMPKGTDLYPLAGGVNAVLRTIANGVVGTAELFYKPRQGIQKLTCFQVTGMLGIVGGIYDSLESMPKFWGSTVRHHEPTGALDGFAEGVKSFAYGFGDGIGGLVYKPVLGGKKDGWVGAGRGLLQGIADMHVKPAAGALALVAQPTKGIINAMGKSKRKASDPLVKPRQDTSREAFDRSTIEERQSILDAFNIAVKDTKNRKKQLKQQALERIEKEKQALEEVEREKTAAIEAEQQAALEADQEARRVALEVHAEAQQNVEAKRQARAAAIEADKESRRSPAESERLAKRAAMEAEKQAKKSAIETDKEAKRIANETKKAEAQSKKDAKKQMGRSNSTQ